jgi:hypothetical protein
MCSTRSHVEYLTSVGSGDTLMSRGCRTEAKSSAVLDRSDHTPLGNPGVVGEGARLLAANFSE